jgi:hypothetical protein
VVFNRFAKPAVPRFEVGAFYMLAGSKVLVPSVCTDCGRGLTGATAPGKKVVSADPRRTRINPYCEPCAVQATRRGDLVDLEIQ